MRKAHTAFGRLPICRRKYGGGAFSVFRYNVHREYVDMINVKKNSLTATKLQKKVVILRLVQQKIALHVVIDVLKADVRRRKRMALKSIVAAGLEQSIQHRSLKKKIVVTN